MAGVVRGAHLERVLLVRPVGQLEQALHQRGGDPLAEQPVVDRHVHHVPDRVVARADQVAHDPLVDRRRQADARTASTAPARTSRATRASETRAARSRSPAAGPRRSGGGSRARGSRRLGVGCSQVLGEDGLRRLVPAPPAPAGRRAGRAPRGSAIRRHRRLSRPPRAPLEIVSTRLRRPAPSRPASRTRSATSSGARDERRPDHLAVGAVQGSEHLAAAGVDQGEPQTSRLDPGRQRRQRRDRPQRQVAGARQRARRRDPDAQSGEGARAPPRPRSPPGSPKLEPGALHHVGDRRHQLPRVRRARGQPAPGRGTTSKRSPSARSTQAALAEVEVSMPSSVTRS